MGLTYIPILTAAKFERLPIPKQIKQAGFFPCANHIYHKNGYFKEYLSFSFKSKNKLPTWHYKRLFSSASKDVLYVLICNNCYFSFIYLIFFIVLENFILHYSS